MKYILEYIEDEDAEANTGYILVGLLALCLILRCFCQQHGYHVANKANVRTFAAFVNYLCIYIYIYIYSMDLYTQRH